MATNKKYNFKFYERDGSLITTMNPRHLANEIAITGLLNSGMGELRLVLNLPFDSYSDSVSYVANMKFVKVYEYDSNNLNGRLVFVGYNQRFVPKLNTSVDNVTLKFLGLGSLLKQTLFGTQPNFTVDHETVAEDVGQIARDIIDQLNADIGDSYDWITYETAGVDQTAFLKGSTNKIKFIDTDMFDAMESCRNLAGGDWYWHIDGTGVFHFREKGSTADHTFQVKKNIKDLEIDSHIADIANDVTLEWDDPTRSNGDDATSIAAYGRFTKIINDISIKDSATATDRINTELDKFKNPRLRVAIEITSDYDIESIRVGQTCRVIGMKTAAGDLSENMQIVSLKYKPDTIVLELDDTQNFGKSISQL